MTELFATCCGDAPDFGEQCLPYALIHLTTAKTGTLLANQSLSYLEEALPNALALNSELDKGKRPRR